MIVAQLTPILVLLVLGVVLGTVIGLVVRWCAVTKDARLEQVASLLPGVNCGGCGFPGCAAFAQALVEGRADPSRCVVNTAENRHRIGVLLQLALTDVVPQAAIIRCGGDANNTLRTRYNGIADCRAATLVAGGPNYCPHGCLGLGSCARGCPFHAIEITVAGGARVHPDVCVGCGRCLEICPRRLIILAPKAAQLHVYCNSPSKGSEKTRLHCKAACIGCQKCVKAAEPGQMRMDASLARINYETPPATDIAAVCPTHALRPPPHARVAAEDAT